MRGTRETTDYRDPDLGDEATFGEIILYFAESKDF